MTGCLQTYKIYMQIPDHVNSILDMLEECGFEAYIVGGCVRDSLLGIKPKDWDITSNATPMQIEQIFKDSVKTFEVLPIGLEYGTLGVLHITTKQVVEITTYRTDGVYKDGRRPESIHFVTMLKKDLSRRDFTINALACRKIKTFHSKSFKYKSLKLKLSLHCKTERKLQHHTYQAMELVDYYNGIEHLNARKISCVGQAERRFLEDSLRIMRAIRFSAVLPFEFKLHNKTKQAIHTLTHRLRYIAKEMICVEFVKLLCGSYAHKAMSTYQDTILFFIPVLNHLTREQLQINYMAISLAPKNVAIRLVLLCCPAPYAKGKLKNYMRKYKYNCQCLHLDNKTIQTSLVLLQLVCDNALLESHNNKIAIKYLLSKYDMQIVWQLISIYAILQKSHKSLNAENNKDFINHAGYNTEKLGTIVCDLATILTTIVLNKECYKLSQLSINGNILQDVAKSMGISLQGKQIGTLLTKLLCDVIEERIPNDKSVLITESKLYIRELSE